ncbi:30S ribosomal protein S15 [Candidatus Neptunichlamydia sp. REUL1]|uniref:30S ribosomal protein S15 n=1 Tax=Candidatus Neptunichlamydia sp. REUL1 TaxID=3064277 RepID=UPI00293085CE|nr:30S ribosomal protein S15 [Candidatus Neptunochlamydia sp. REUL1]
MSAHTQSPLTSHLISTKQAAQIIGCSVDSLKGYISRGALRPSKTVSGRNFYCEEKIRNFTPPSKVHRGKSLSSKSSTVSSIDVVEMRDVIKKWRTSPQDNSSSDVEIGVYTEKIQRLEMDMRATPRESSEFVGMRKQLVKYVFERRKLLNYLQKSHFSRYLKAMKRINS